jgi:hypothetical protein
MRFSTLVLLFALATWALPCPAESQDKSKPNTAKAQKPAAPFRWVNPLPKNGNWPPGLKHGTFQSPSMKIDVGYCIYLPPTYHDASNADARYPVVYYLHGGRPGSEIKAVKLTSFIHSAMAEKKVAPAIYVFVNGGEVSHYNYPQKNSLGEDVFVNELIPHVDATYRTIATRAGRAIEGFSQGGRGTTRIMFRHADLFCSAAPGGSGYATEKIISEQHGRESEHLHFAEGYNTWDIAREYAKNPRPEPEIKILVHVGTKGFNYQCNLDYMNFLESLKIPFERLIVPDAPHSASMIYEKDGMTLLKFHEANFEAAR